MLAPSTRTIALTLAAASLVFPGLSGAEDGEVTVEGQVGDEGGEDALPLAAARRWLLVEPLGATPSPWVALSGALDGGVTVDGELGWTGVRIHVPVARRYGAVDARLVADFDDDGLASLGPELTLRGLPLRLADDRGLLGFALSFKPALLGMDPLITLGGGLLGGYLSERWFTWAYFGVTGEVLLGRYPELLGAVAAGLRLPHGLRPQVEVEVGWEARRHGEASLAVRPGFRYWPTDFLGIGISADIWALGPDITTSAIRIDVIGHALE